MLDEGFWVVPRVVLLRVFDLLEDGDVLEAFDRRHFARQVASGRTLDLWVGAVAEESSAARGRLLKQ